MREISVEYIADGLYEISHNEYGDAKSIYDLSLHTERMEIALAIHNLLYSGKKEK